MNYKKIYVCLGFGLGNIATITLPFAYSLAKKDVVTIFFVHKNGMYKNIFHKKKKLTIKFYNRENELELLDSYTVKIANNIKELKEMLNNPDKKSSSILYPFENLIDIIKENNISIVLAFSAVGSKNLNDIVYILEKNLNNKYSIPLYLFENLSAEKEKILKEYKKFNKIDIRNCVIDRISNGIKINDDIVTINTTLPQNACIRYEYYYGDFNFLDITSDINLIPMKKSEIIKRENEKYFGTNFIDYIIARYSLLKKIKKYSFQKYIKVSSNKIGNFIDEECEKDLLIMIKCVETFLQKIGYDREKNSHLRIDKMKVDTFARILKTDRNTYNKKLLFAQQKSKHIIQCCKGEEGVHIIKEALFT